MQQLPDGFTMGMSFEATADGIRIVFNTELPYAVRIDLALYLERAFMAAMQEHAKLVGARPPIRVDGEDQHKQ